ncbi:MAG TPA: hypothetical protein VKG85_05040 [Actinomycetes bacterium]|nr:hypothetical protein [Actinomycetes bacterium]
MQKAVLDALVEEATRKSGLIWVGVADQPPRPVWHIWHDAGAYLVVGGREQQLPGVDGVQTVSVTVRSKDKGGRLVTWTAKPRQVVPDGTEWATVVPILHGKRLNASDGEQQPERWRRESLIYRLEPTGFVAERPDTMPTDSQAAAPLETPATTRGRLPFVIGKATRRNSRR